MGFSVDHHAPSPMAVLAAGRGMELSYIYGIDLGSQGVFHLKLIIGCINNFHPQVHQFFSVLNHRGDPQKIAVHHGEISAGADQVH